MNCKDCAHYEIKENKMYCKEAECQIYHEIIEEECCDYEEIISTGKILDSGTRRTFETGAVRDIQTGKGRMDLLPWQAIIELSKHCEEGALKYGERNIDKGLPIHSLIDSAFRHLAKYAEGETDEPHLRAALWNIAWAMQFEVTMPEMQDIPNRTDEWGTK